MQFFAFCYYCVIKRVQNFVAFLTTQIYELFFNYYYIIFVRRSLILSVLSCLSVQNFVAFLTTQIYEKFTNYKHDIFNYAKFIFLAGFLTYSYIILNPIYHDYQVIVHYYTIMIIKLLYIIILS